MKKILGALLMLSMAIGGTVLAPNTTKNVQAATTIQSNRWYEGMTDGEKSRVYTYKMQGSGYFYYQVITDTDGYYYEDEYVANNTHFVYASMTQNYKKYDSSPAIWNTDGGYVSEKYSFKAGEKVTIKINDIEYRKSHYKLKVTFVKRKNFEKEKNNSRSKANKIKKGITYTGLVMNDDVDWFVFKAPKTKKYKIKAVKVSDTIYSSWVDTYKGYSKKKSVSISGGDGWRTAYSGKLKKGQKIYIKISGSYGRNNGSDEMYKITVR